MNASLIACGGGTSAIDREGFETDPMCAPGATPAIERLRIALGADWVSAGNAESGAACATATDKPACSNRLAELRARMTYGMNVGPLPYFLTRGDDVRGLDRTNVAASLAPIDDPMKAYYLALASDYRITCDRFIRATSDGYEVIGQIETSACNPFVVEERKVAVKRDGTLTVLERKELRREEDTCVAVGRRPRGLIEHAHVEPAVVGSWFARAAELEAAAVIAFEILSEELSHHGAPARLMRACERARRDEIRHTRMMTKLARRFGGEPKCPAVERHQIRSLTEIAIENAVEGCVRETYGALEAALACARATDGVVARTMRLVARDEARHAALSWEILAWSRSQVDGDARRAIEAAMAAATSALERELARPRDPQLQRIAGLPSPAQAMVAMAALQERLWSMAA